MKYQLHYISQVNNKPIKKLVISAKDITEAKAKGRDHFNRLNHPFRVAMIVRELP